MAPVLPPHSDTLARFAEAAWHLTGDEDRVLKIMDGGLLLAHRVIISASPDYCDYVHFWENSDPADLHDHPWDCVSQVLRIGFWETIETTRGFSAPVRERVWRKPGETWFRYAEDRHRIELDPNLPKPVSRLLAFRERREWGFWTEPAAGGAAGFVIGRDYRAGRRQP